MAGVFQSKKHLRVEKWIYRCVGASPDAEMRWPAYLRGVLFFSAVSVLFLYLLQRVQDKLPLSLGFKPISADQAFNTAASFVSNMNWQSYSGETAMSHVAQTMGLAVQNFVSAAVGIAVAVALVRGFALPPRSASLARRTPTRPGDLGNFWADLVRGTVRILVPLSVVAAVVLIACGAIQNCGDIHTITTLTGDKQAISPVGLGLAVARGFAEAMDGTLAAEDTPGGGLTMVLAVPVAGRSPQARDLSRAVVP